MYTLRCQVFLLVRTLVRIQEGSSKKVHQMSSAWDIDDIAKQSLLCDFYGKLLTDRQREITELYTQENYSLAEIAEELGISRQAVHDALRSARRALSGYEEKLGLVQRFLRTEEMISRIDTQIMEMIEAVEKGGTTGEQLVQNMKEIRSVIDRIEE